MKMGDKLRVTELIGKRRELESRQFEGEVIQITKYFFTIRTKQGYNTSYLFRDAEIEKIDTYSKTKDNTERNKKVVENMGLVGMAVQRRKTAIEYNGSEELVQVGTIGLINAANNYKEEFNTAFSTYAVPVIVGKIRRYLRDKRYVAIGRETKLKIYRMRKKEDEILKETGIEATNKELAEYLEVTEKEVEELKLITYQTNLLRLDAAARKETDGNKNNEINIFLSCEDNTQKSLAKVEVERLLNKLTDRERNIIIHRYINNLTQAETAKLFNLSQVQICRIEKKALIKMREVA